MTTSASPSVSTTPRASVDERHEHAACGGPWVERIDAAAYAVPVDPPESDGTLRWDRTVMVVAHARADGCTGLGYTYADTATARFIQETLAPVVQDMPALDVPAIHRAMWHALRNLGRGGIGAMALSAVDNALWDLKARLLDVPLATLLGQVRDSVDIYGSGGFTSDSIDAVRSQLTEWVEQGARAVKMKVGREPQADPQRVASVRQGIGNDIGLFVDANGAYDRQQALAMAHRFADESNVSWFEEPVSSDDIDGLRLMRDRSPVGMEVAAGEYGYDLFTFRRLMEAQAVDVVMADVTRCGGISEFLQIAALCEAFGLPLSAHTAPAQSLAPCLAAGPVRHLEYFHDHVRVESLLLDGVPAMRDGALRADLSRPGNSLTLKQADAQRYAL